MHIKFTIQPEEVPVLVDTIAKKSDDLGIMLRGSTFVVDGDYEVASLRIDGMGSWVIDIDEAFGPGRVAFDLIAEVRAALDEGMK